MMRSNYYTFSSLRGQQGQSSYYIIQCPLQLVPRLFLFDEIKATGTGIRYASLSAAKIEEMEHYLESRKDNYILTPLVASVEGEVKFNSISEHEDIGLLHISLTANLVIKYGQHRCAAIQQAIAQNPEIGNDSISVMIIPTTDAVRKAEVAVAINYTQTKSNRSLRILHEQDNPLATLTKQIVDNVPLFQNRIEMHKTTISNRSTAFFTLSAVHQANKTLLNYEEGNEIDTTQNEIAHMFWNKLAGVITEWQQLEHGEITSAYLRERYVHAHTVTLVAIGIAGHALIQACPDTWPDQLKKLQMLDWSRQNTQLWEGRAMLQGRMSKAHRSIRLTANALKLTLGLSLDDKEQEMEEQLASQK